MKVNRFTQLEICSNIWVGSGGLSSIKNMLCIKSLMQDMLYAAFEQCKSTGFSKQV